MIYLTKRIHVTIPDSLVLAIEEEYHRIHQELLKLKRSGRYPKSKRLTQTMIRTVVIKLGLKEFKEINYEQFEKLLKQKAEV